MGTLENKFTWSASRASTFRRCLRAYWWQYYGAWGGWERNAPAKAREAYILKNLTSRWAWTGTSVHQRIEQILGRLHTEAAGGHLPLGEEGIDVEAEVEALTTRMRKDYGKSLTGDYWRFPKRAFGLMEHAYEDDVPGSEWKRNSEKARQALRSFLTSDVFATIQASDPTTWFPIERLDQFEVEGVGVWAAPDFASRRPGGGADLYDWKTGAVRPESSRLQLACYTLYMQARHDIAPSTLVCRLVYLGDQVEVHEMVFTPQELDDARAEMRASMDEMRARLKDPAANVAEADAFPLTDDRSACRSCVYRRLCGR